MSEPELRVSYLPSDSQEEALVRYRRPSLLAITGLVLGILSFTALYEEVLYVLALLGVGCSVGALRALAREEHLVGRKAACAGLVLCWFWTAAAPAHWIAMRYWLRQEARQVAELWFDLLRQGEAHKAFQLTRHPNSRHPLDDKTLLDYYRKNPREHAMLWEYVGNGERRPLQPENPSLVRTLLALGSKAEIHYVGTEAQRRQNSTEEVFQIYAVTFEQQGRRTTFFVGVELKRYLVGPKHKASWQVVQTLGGVRPSGQAPPTSSG